MQFLGHKNITNTMMYIQIDRALFQDANDEFICKIAKTVEDAQALIELGFEYVCDIDDIKLFRRRK